MKMEDRDFQNQRIFKRSLMEAQGGAEIRRLHIIYFLSRKGVNEDAHLIRIHHLSKNGVRLKDIKRWLGELRGKDMPESFAWSFKRRYKAGYIWQDLLDDDLVTPISDNEFVLKGSEITSSTTSNIDFSCSEIKITMHEERSSLQESAKDCQKPESKGLENQIHSSEIEESSPTVRSETSTLTDDSGKDEVEKNSDIVNQQANSSTSYFMPLLSKEKIRSTNKVEMETSTMTDDSEKDELGKNSDRANQEVNFSASTPLLSKEKRTKNAEIIHDKNIYTTAESSDKPRFRKSHSSRIFWNLITCGDVDTNDSAVVMTNRCSRPFFNTCSCHSEDEVKDSVKEKGQCREQRAPPAAYKPLYGPNCSQCGKKFKPEKLHAHMKSCKGMKALVRGCNPSISAAGSISIISTPSRHKDLVSGHFLTR